MISFVMSPIGIIAASNFYKDVINNRIKFLCLIVRFSILFVVKRSAKIKEIENVQTEPSK